MPLAIASSQQCARNRNARHNMQAVIVGPLAAMQCPLHERASAGHPAMRGNLLFNVEPYTGRCASHSVLHLCRVCFADGPLQDIYGTPDGHPSHEGQTARQRRSLNTSYPVDLTPHSIRMLEQELGESYRLSINRLKRR